MKKILFLLVVLLPLFADAQKAVVESYIKSLNNYCRESYDRRGSETMIESLFTYYQDDEEQWAKMNDEMTRKVLELCYDRKIDTQRPCNVFSSDIEAPAYMQCFKWLGITQATIVSMNETRKSGFQCVTAIITYSGGVYANGHTMGQDFVISNGKIYRIDNNKFAYDQWRNGNPPQNFDGYVPYAVFKDSTLTLYYGKQKPNGAYEMRTSWDNGWYSIREQIKTVVFDESFQHYRPKTCRCLFYECGNLTQITGLGYLNTEDVTDMSHMFYGFHSLTRLDVSHFNTTKVTNMRAMFQWCEKLTSLDLSSFVTDNVTDMSCMFYFCSSLTRLDVSRFNTAKVTKMNSMFQSCGKLTSLDVSGFRTDNVTDMAYMFSYCRNLTRLDVSHFNTAKVTNMNSMFYYCNKLTSLDVSGFRTDNVTDMSFMFSWCHSLTRLDVSHFNTAKVTNMRAMFYACYKLTTLDVSGFSTDNVTDMYAMFNCCRSLTRLDVSHFNTAKVTNMSTMFQWCESVTTLDLSSFVTDNVTDMSDMLSCCYKLTTVYVNNFNTSKVTKSEDMFLGSSNLVGGRGTRYKKNNITDYSYARIDGGKSAPGYFTRKP